jgi:F-type H+-transporting ATPase subunit epsilon
MTAPLRCTVVSPERPLFEGGAEHVVVPGTKGELGIWPRHASLIAKLEPGVVRIHRPPSEGGAVEKFAVGGGFLQVRKDVVTLLVTDAQRKDDVDAKAARAELEKVLEELRHPSSDERFRDLLQSRRRLRAQLSLV